MVDAVEALRAEATEALAASDEQWRPAARQITAWLEAERQAREATERAKTLKEAETFYKEAEQRIRAERFEPIAGRARELWAALRQRSNVSLERVALEGQLTSRSVALDVTVDGAGTSALGVMSQGELHALALALFLPRVTSNESPFRFLLIDDPVQAMDPARVDGLARVLDEVARDRQVILFTHDDRLPAACRRLGVDAEVVTVTRNERSAVSTSFSPGPAESAMNDAFTLAKSQQIPPELRAKVVPVHCRRAIEAKLRDLTWSRWLAQGRSHQEVEALLDAAPTTVELLGVWLFGEEPQRGDEWKSKVYGRVDVVVPGSAKQLRFVNAAAHGGVDDVDTEVLTGTVRRLLRKLDEVSL